MQLTAKIKNKSTAWSVLLKVRVLDVVSNLGSYYQNISGINGDITDTSHWFPIYTPNSNQVIEINKVAGDVSGADPDFTVNLASDGMPAFPASIGVYIDLNNTGVFAEVSPVNYDPASATLHGMNDPTAFPNQKIKIRTI